MAMVPQLPFRTPLIAEGALLEQRVWVVYLSALILAVNKSTPAGTYADNAAAVAAGLEVGQFYNTATGEVRVVV